MIIAEKSYHSPITDQPAPQAPMPLNPMDKKTTNFLALAKIDPKPKYRDVPAPPPCAPRSESERYLQESRERLQIALRKGVPPDRSNRSYLQPFGRLPSKQPARDLGEKQINRPRKFFLYEGVDTEET